ncbi:hypothetical protein GGX14DRAFT_661844 [Mycena pura]|uniref:Uncharacterized protein n=1 Tax=Mycena pura TaxID=153505 RepID=A0AAD6V494_9AGAR|nr:hypothetical protein GGX14DRAFT_661844 [Mycena pura]
MERGNAYVVGLEPPWEILNLIAAHKYKRHDQQYPSFMYADDSFDEDDPRIGLCQGTVVVRTLRHQWTTPRSAIRGLGEKSIPPDANARIHDVDKVMPPMVGYAVSQAYVSMMPNDWDKVPKVKELYDQIIQDFADSPVWAQKTLDFLTSEVFDGLAAPRPDDDDVHDDPSPAMNHRAQIADLARREREEAAAAAAAAAEHN